MALEEYRRKRSFSRTPEPSGKKKPESPGHHFVVQRHDASRLHYDFRLEMRGVLKSWAVPKGPPVEVGVRHLAVHVEDHPLEYRTFHGRIPAGEYGAGTVTIWDSGTYDPVEPADVDGPEADRAMEKGHVRVVLHGKKLKGGYLLVQFGNEKKNWLMMKTGGMEEGAAETQPARSRKKAPMPRDVEPMLAHLAEKPFDDPGWIYEIKWDGYRAVAEIKNGNVRLYSRHRQPYNDTYPQVAKDLARIGHDAVIDGEIVALDRAGRSSFQLLQEYKKHPGATIVYYVFDLLYLDGRDLRETALTERKRLLRELIRDSDHVRFSSHVEKEGIKLFALARRKNAEGVMAKKKDSRYEPARSYAWQKIKNIRSEEAVICGFTRPRRTRTLFGALILGQYDENGTLKYVGHSGSGFSEESLKSLYGKMRLLVTDRCPFPETPATNEPATWVRPKLVAQIKFREWTKEGVMRQPVFIGLREDKPPSEVHAEAPPVPSAGDSGQYTHLDKVFWPREGYTKGDVIAYYGKIAPVILPYLKDRPESLNRHPDGIDGDSFFQKDIKDAPSWTKTVSLRSETEHKTINWLICNDKRTLTYMANLGCIELNPWISRYRHPDNPDFLVLDLDPEHIPFPEVVRTARTIKTLLDRIHAESFVKTSGKRGLHIMVPLGARYTAEESRLFAELVARKIADILPKTASVARMPEKRQHRVYVDFLQNRSGQTISAPYCIRPVPGAPVSTPLTWDELTEGLDPKKFTIRTVFGRLEKKGDVWEKLITHKGIDMQRSLDGLNAS